VSVALFWDIDGTLLTTARAGVFALEAAVREIAGAEFDLQRLATAGLTDAAIAALALERAGVEPADELVERFLRAYERHLPEMLHRRHGHVMPGVVALLDDLGGRDDVRSYLLTGNTEAGARAKLAHYGLLSYFDGGGSFCLGPGERAEIARRALPLANGSTPYVIGDTPHDIACGKAIGARTIAVATGSYTSDQLSPHEPWRLLARLPEPAMFGALIGLDS
jgi:phosphoglycolate phosphatase-like HAD superfamily hydrolase